MPGKERGTQPYGGYGYASSSISINGKITPKPTLPQRDIYEALVKPLMTSKEIEKKKALKKKATKIVIKDVRKLLSLKTIEITEERKMDNFGKSYVDALDIIASDSQRYIEFSMDKAFTLLGAPNASHIAILEPKHIHQIRALKKFLEQKKIEKEELTTFLYSVAKKRDATDKENKVEQLQFFKNVYQLLLARESGPRLPLFLLDVDRSQVLSLLDV
jgi:lysyl-tRNA synthetase class I